jgi:hypothetical protein
MLLTRRVLKWSAALTIALSSAFVAVAAGSAVANGGASDVAPVSSLRVVSEVETHASTYRLTYDSTRQAIWFVDEENTGPATLFSFDTTTSTLSSWQLPDASYNGFLSEAEVAPDGSIWVTEPYRLIRVDPTLNTVANLDLSLTVDQALPGAYDPDGPMPGTWISGITFWNNHVVVARNNVPYLSVFSADFAQLPSIPVPAQFAGSLGLGVDVDNELVLLSGLLSEGTVAKLGAAMQTDLAPQSALRLRQVGEQVLLTGGDSGYGDPSNVADGLGAGPEDRDYPTPTGGYAVYSLHGRDISVIRGGSVVARMPLPVAEGEAHGVRVVTSPEVTDLVVDDSGVIWYFDLGRGTLVGLVQS